MSKTKVIVLSVVEQGLSKAEAARRYDVSWRWVHTLVQRYMADGMDGIEPRSRRPRSNPNTITDQVRTRIIELREKLPADGLDAGPATIAWHLAQEGLHTPSISTIRRIITTAGLVTPEPRKRPRSSLRRFAAEQPNETWQSDFTHWPLADGTDTEILNWLDDHSRYLLSCTAHPRVTGDLVVDTFTTCINTYGPPASTLTDNGSCQCRACSDPLVPGWFRVIVATLLGGWSGVGRIISAGEEGAGSSAAVGQAGQVHAAAGPGVGVEGDRS